jgi:integrase
LDLFDGLEYSPTTHVSSRRIIGEKTRRPRVLDDREVRLFWQATASLAYPWGPCARLLFLSAARLREVAELSWPEVDADQAMIVVPPRRMKSKVEHAIPLVPAMQTIIDGLPRFQGGRFLFSSSGGRTPTNSFSNLKARLDDEMAKIVRRELGLRDGEPIPEPHGIRHWVLHDLRRTARSLMSRAGVSPDIAERCLAHAIGGIRGVYDRHSFIKEKRHALETLAAEIERIVVPPPANVVPLRKPVTA